MSKYDDYVQSEEETEMLIYEEWLSYVEEVGVERQRDWEDWVNSVGWTDQAAVSAKTTRSSFVILSAKIALDKLKSLRQNVDIRKEIK